MLHAIWRVLTDAIEESADDDVLKHLASAWVAAYDAEVDDAANEVADSDEKAHRIFVAAYYGRKTLAPQGDSYVDDNPSEVSVPDWAPRFAPLLRRLARAERERDAHTLAMLRRLIIAQRDGVA